MFFFFIILFFYLIQKGKSVIPKDNKYNAKGLYYNCRIPNAVALTYDDGPSSETTDIILDTLKKHDVKATFFIIGQHVESEKGKKILKRIDQEGHLIANHTYSHPHLDNMSQERIKREITLTDNLIQSVIGKKPIFVRPPYGAYNEEVLDLLFDCLNKKVIMWNLDVKDWEFTATQLSILEKFQETFSKKCSKCHSWIPLQHDSYRITAEVQDLVIKQIKKSGYKFVTMDECIGKPGLKYCS